MSKIKLLVMDVDGTLTDGRIYIGTQGEVMKAFDVRDGYAIANILPSHSIEPAIITGRISEIVQHRAQELKITMLYQGVSNKLDQLIRIAEEKQIKKEEIAYIGDDLNDLDCIQFCGMTACPHDAVSDVLKQVDYICTQSGGRGAVREFIDYLTRVDSNGCV